MLTQFVMEAAIAKELDYSVTAVSQFINDKYAEDNAEFAARVGQLPNMGAVRETLAKDRDFCIDLSNTKNILNHIKMAHATGDILLLYGLLVLNKLNAIFTNPIAKPFLISR